MCGWEAAGNEGFLCLPLLGAPAVFTRVALGGVLAAEPGGGARPHHGAVDRVSTARRIAVGVGAFKKQIEYTTIFCQIISH